MEAARAGDAGAGFAVVADEVRSLAQRAAAAAKETAVKIDSAIGKSAQGVEISAKVASALKDIVAKARQVDDLVSEVAGASREQSQGITQINTAVGQMDRVTQTNAANAEESAAAAKELNAQTETMREAVRELMQLVNGANVRNSAADNPTPEAAPWRSGFGQTKRSPAASIRNGKSGRTTAGVSTLNAPPRQTTASAVPMAGEFNS